MAKDQRRGRRPPEGDRSREGVSGLWASIWPEVSTYEQARSVARFGFWAAVLNVLLTGMLVWVMNRDEATTDPAMLYWAIADMAVFVPIAVGLFFFSRVAAIAGFVLFAASKAFGWFYLSPEPNQPALIIAALFLLFYLHGIRGTVAMARYRSAG